MERTPLGELINTLGNVHSNSLTLSERKKQNLSAIKCYPENSRGVVKPTSRIVTGQEDVIGALCEITEPQNIYPENGDPLEPPRTPSKPSGQITKPGEFSSVHACHTHTLSLSLSLSL